MSVYFLGFPGGSDGEESACNAGDLGSIPGSGRSPGVGNDNTLQYVIYGIYFLIYTCINLNAYLK